MRRVPGGERRPRRFIRRGAGGGRGNGAGSVWKSPPAGGGGERGGDGDEEEEEREGGREGGGRAARLETSGGLQHGAVLPAGGVPAVRGSPLWALGGGFG